MKKIKLLIPYFLLVSCTSTFSSISNNYYSSALSNEITESSISSEKKMSETELISFSADNIINVDENEFTKVETTDISLFAVVKNESKYSFLDMEIYIESLNTSVIFNQGDGDYKCTVETIFDDDLKQWVSNIRFDFKLISERFFMDCFEIKAIRFLDDQVNIVQTVISNNITSKLNIKFDGSLIINNETIEMGEDFVTGFSGVYGTKWYVEAELNITSLSSSDPYSKIGIMLGTDAGNYNTGECKNLFWYLDAPSSKQKTGWADLCAVGQIENHQDWNWSSLVTKVTLEETSIKLNEIFKIGLLRDGVNYTVFAGKGKNYQSRGSFVYDDINENEDTYVWIDGWATNIIINNTVAYIGDAINEIL